MCRLFTGADPELWEPVTRSLRLHGVSTSVRVEAFFWRVLEEAARRDGMSLNMLLTRLYDEVQEADREPGNFCAFLRVCAGRYLALQLSGDIPRDQTVPIRSLDAGAVLARERNRVLARAI
jgi:predicted DNA-binding ribbon-helix-helix protein